MFNSDTGNLEFIFTPDAEAVTGEYFYDCKVSQTSKWAKSQVDADRLWDLSKQLTGIL